MLVGGAVPHPFGPVRVAGLGGRRPIESVAGAERRTLGVEEDHPDGPVALGVVECRTELVAQLVV